MEKVKKFSRKKIILIAIACILIPVIIYFSYLSYLLFFSKTPTFVQSNNDDSVNSSLGLPTEESGIENIVLFGVDNRTPTDHGRTDSIIIATIDKNSKTVKLTSIMRDLYVEIGDTKSMNRINAAYAFGGPELALKTLNQNFGLDLKYYALIDFKAFQDLVDKIGGIDVEVKDYEVTEINKYIDEVNGKNSTFLKGPGFQHLNGQQALSYARIRHVGNGDYERTERQRTVLKCMFEKAKKVDILKLSQLVTTLASYVQTNVPVSRVLSLAATVYKFDGGVQTMRIPVDGYFEGQNVNGAAVLVPDIKANAEFLKEFIYNKQFASNEDVPLYMKNNFHLDDKTVATNKPKPNIPNYRTPDVPLKSEEEQTLPNTKPKTGENDSKPGQTQQGSTEGSTDKQDSGNTTTPETPPQGNNDKPATP